LVDEFSAHQALEVEIGAEHGDCRSDIEHQ
jgi:hypothetical protein